MRGLSGARVEIGLATTAHNLKRTNVLGATKLTEALHHTQLHLRILPIPACWLWNPVAVATKNSLKQPNSLRPRHPGCRCSVPAIAHRWSNLP